MNCVLAIFNILYHANTGTVPVFGILNSIRLLPSSCCLVFECNFDDSLCFQSVATFFSQVMAAVGGNTAGPGMITFLHLIIFSTSLEFRFNKKSETS